MHDENARPSRLSHPIHREPRHAVSRAARALLALSVLVPSGLLAQGEARGNAPATEAPRGDERQDERKVESEVEREQEREVKSGALSDAERRLVLQKVDSIAFLDQQFRRYTSNGTLDEALIARVAKMELRELIAFRRAHKDELTSEQRALLSELQRRNDRRNHEAFVALVKRHGYPSPARLGVKTDRLFPLLLHPPCALEAVPAHVAAMRALLEPEVLAGNMPARSFAMFVDNMCAKILNKPQVYGTNKAFDPKTRKILPPRIESLEKTNRARRKIGLPELGEGEYRLAGR